jgi:CBS domain-containing protein
MQVSEAMTNDVRIASPNQTIRDAARLMAQIDAGVLPVGENDRLATAASQFESAQAMLGKSASVGEVARTTGLTRQTIYRIKDDPAGAEAAFATWGM